MTQLLGSSTLNGGENFAALKPVAAKILEGHLVTLLELTELREQGG